MEKEELSLIHSHGWLRGRRETQSYLWQGKGMEWVNQIIWASLPPLPHQHAAVREVEASLSVSSSLLKEFWQSDFERIHRGSWKHWQTDNKTICSLCLPETECSLELELFSRQRTVSLPQEMPLICTSTGTGLNLWRRKGETSTGKLETNECFQSLDGLWEIAPIEDRS